MSDACHLNTITYVYKGLHGLLPDGVAGQLIPVNTTHNLNTRAAQRNDLTVATFHLDMTRRAFRYRGPYFLNLTEDEVRTANSVKSMKAALKDSDMFAII